MATTQQYPSSATAATDNMKWMETVGPNKTLFMKQEESELTCRMQCSALGKPPQIKQQQQKGQRSFLMKILTINLF